MHKENNIMETNRMDTHLHNTIIAIIIAASTLTLGGSRHVVAAILIATSALALNIVLIINGFYDNISLN